MFDNLVDVTEPICQEIDEQRASMTIFDTSGIEAYVTENNPKYTNAIIVSLKLAKSQVLIVIMTLIRLLTRKCLHMLQLILPLNNFT